MVLLLNDAPNYLSGAGLVWDIAGAYLLARGLWVNDTSIFDLAATGWGFTGAIVRSGCEHRLDTKFGLWLLIGGFAIQAVSSVLVKVDFKFSMWIALLVVLPLSWLGAHYKVWVLGDSLRVLKVRAQGGIQEATLRETFSDYPDRIWKMVVINSGYEFAAPPPLISGCQMKLRDSPNEVARYNNPVFSLRRGIRDLFS